MRKSLPLLAATALAVWAYGGTTLAAPKLTVLHSFANIRGVEPFAGVIADGAGNLYGTTTLGGAHNDGEVFELKPPAVGKKAWTEKVLRSFNGTNGSNPGAGLIADGAGNLFGTTSSGGANSYGVVFELSPPAMGMTAWTETVLQSFDLRGTSGGLLNGGLLADSAGNLYGTTQAGGATSYGAVFELSPPAAGQTAWTETVLFSFNLPTGYDPTGSLIADSAGNLYGTTVDGGGYGDGVVFELKPPAAGKRVWTYTVLHTFDGTDGGNPSGSLLADGAGNLYGTTQYGGTNGDGVVFELNPPAPGKRAWTETVLFSFNGPNGELPDAGLLADGAGNLFGTTVYGGAGYVGGGGPHGDGAVFKLSPPAAGETVWTETVLQSFNGTNGSAPQAALIADGAGDLYGTTVSGGAHGVGVVFRLTP